MPRCARIKESEAIYHIICRSISEIDLFRDTTDKEKYIELILKYKSIFNFKIYAYCLMDNHLHIMIYSNGADISKVMHGINQSYSQYYNRKYSRYGHVFQDRFKSKVVDNDRYMFVLSLYIHNNVRDLKHVDTILKYRFSSLPIYLGIHSNHNKLVEPEVILSRLCKNINKARKRYLYLLNGSMDQCMPDDNEIMNNIVEYRSERVSRYSCSKREEVLLYLGTYFSTSTAALHFKHLKGNMTYKSIAVLMFRGLCDMSIREICAFVGNVSQSYISKLCNKGYLLINTLYPDVISGFMSQKNSA